MINFDTKQQLLKKVNTNNLKEVEGKKLPKHDLVKTEINIERNPIFTTSKFRGNSREIIRGIVNNDNGVTTVSKITIGKVKREDGQIVEVGVLKTSHLKVLYGVLKLWTKNSLPPTGEVSFSRNELRKVMGGKHGGWVHKRIKQWLFDLFNIPLVWEHSFYDAEKKQTIEKVDAFRFFNSVSVFSKSNNTNTAGFQKSKIVLNEMVVRNILNQGGKNLIFDVILNIRGEIALLLYRFLDWKLSRLEKPFEKKLKELFEELGLDTSSSKYQYPSGRKQILEEAIKELDGKEISTGTLRLSIKETKDGDDFKLRAEKVNVLKLNSQYPSVVGQEGARINDLVNQIIGLCGDEHSRTFYSLIAEKMSSDVIYRALSETKDAYQRGAIKDTKAKYFTGIVKCYAQTAGIDLFS